MTTTAPECVQPTPRPATPKRIPRHLKQRTMARRCAMQALYQWQFTRDNLATIEATFIADEDLKQADYAYFHELLHRSRAEGDAIDAAIAPFLDRPWVQVDPVEKAVLWVGVYELLYRPDLPYRVVINEAVELAKIFGAEQGHRFVNGVLDRLARSQRQTEVNTK